MVINDTLVFLFSHLLFLALVYCATACDKCLHRSKASYISSTLSVGACGYGSMSERFNGYYVAAGSYHLYRDGVGCGACFQIRCKHPRTCNSDGVQVVLTDLNKRNKTSDFLITRGAFMAMAKDGMSNEMKKLRSVDVEYKRIPCEYMNKNLMIRVEEKSSKPDYLAIKFLYQGGQTDIVAVDVAQVESSNWQYMDQDHGPIWSTSRVPTGPLEFRLVVTGGYGGRWVRARQEVLPVEWKIGSVYDFGAQITDVAQESCSKCVY